MNRIDNYKFKLEGTLRHLKGRVHPDLHQGVTKTSQQIMAHLDNYNEARSKIKANPSLSKTGKNEQIAAIAKTAYEDIHGMRQQSDYRGHIAQLNTRIDQLTPEHTTEQKLLRQLQMGEIRGHLARLSDQEILSVYSDATSTGDLLTAESIETAPGFLFDHALLGPITAAAQEKRRTELDPSLTGQISELERADSATRILFNDAEMILSTEADIISDVAGAEISMEAGADGN